ncbi:phospholipase effector Tle1 domain-containing protein, partial [Acinetobacter baumannii]|uniref:phospholipase effector Tle1 domain-containing protein n=1 Tax=Acinetobacter baumannii TaxID=470 RepID=UPI00331CEEA4
MEQVWFRGAHGDIGGQLGNFDAARPLANIPLVWLLDRAEALGLTLPEGWRARYPCDAGAPMVGTWRSWGKWFLMRRKRV